MQRGIHSVPLHDWLRSGFRASKFDALQSFRSIAGLAVKRRRALLEDRFVTELGSSAFPQGLTDLARKLLALRGRRGKL